MKPNTSVRLVLAASLLLSLSVAFVPTASAYTFTFGGQCSGTVDDHCTCTHTSGGCIKGQDCRVWVDYPPYGWCIVG